MTPDTCDGQAYPTALGYESCTNKQRMIPFFSLRQFCLLLASDSAFDFLFSPILSLHYAPPPSFLSNYDLHDAKETSHLFFYPILLQMSNEVIFIIMKNCVVPFSSSFFSPLVWLSSPWMDGWPLRFQPRLFLCFFSIFIVIYTPLNSRGLLYLFLYTWR